MPRGDNRWTDEACRGKGNTRRLKTTARGRTVSASKLVQSLLCTTTDGFQGVDSDIKCPHLCMYFAAVARIDVAHNEHERMPRFALPLRSGSLREPLIEFHISIVISTDSGAKYKFTSKPCSGRVLPPRDGGTSCEVARVSEWRRSCETGRRNGQRQRPTPTTIRRRMEQARWARLAANRIIGRPRGRVDGVGSRDGPRAWRSRQNPD